MGKIKRSNQTKPNQTELNAKKGLLSVCTVYSLRWVFKNVIWCVLRRRHNTNFEQWLTITSSEQLNIANVHRSNNSNKKERRQFSRSMQCACKSIYGSVVQCGRLCCLSIGKIFSSLLFFSLFLSLRPHLTSKCIGKCCGMICDAFLLCHCLQPKPNVCNDGF